MYLRIVLLCAILAISQTNAFVKRDAPASTQIPALESFQGNIEQFKSCLDQAMGKAIGDNVKQLQPVINVISDQINKFSRAFEELSGTSNKKQVDPDLVIQV